jgi:hypothetical protein
MIRAEDPPAVIVTRAIESADRMSVSRQLWLDGDAMSRESTLEHAATRDSPTGLPKLNALAFNRRTSREATRPGKNHAFCSRVQTTSGRARRKRRRRAESAAGEPKAPQAISAHRQAGQIQKKPQAY